MSALNVDDGLFVTDDGSVFPITNWLDADGDECDPADALMCVAGEGHCWFSLPLSDFETVRIT